MTATTIHSYTRNLEANFIIIEFASCEKVLTLCGHKQRSDPLFSNRITYTIRVSKDGQMLPAVACKNILYNVVIFAHAYYNLFTRT